MKKNVIVEIPTAIRIDTELKQKIDKSLEVFNKNDSGVKLTISGFIRGALEDYCKKILTSGLTISIKPSI